MKSIEKTYQWEIYGGRELTWDLKHDWNSNTSDLQPYKKFQSLGLISDSNCCFLKGFQLLQTCSVLKTTVLKLYSSCFCCYRIAWELVKNAEYQAQTKTHWFGLCLLKIIEVIETIGQLKIKFQITIKQKCANALQTFCQPWISQ